MYPNGLPLMAACCSVDVRMAGAYRYYKEGEH